MTYPLSQDHSAELSAIVREPRYLVEVGFPSGTVKLTTGDPAKVDTATEQWGTVIHGFYSVRNLSVGSVQLVFLLGDSSFISDFFSTALGGKDVNVWSYYELETGTVRRCDAKYEHSGRISRVRGGLQTAMVESIKPVHNYPKTRINATGGFNWQTTPRVLAIGNTIVNVQRRGLR